MPTEPVLAAEPVDPPMIVELVDPTCRVPAGVIRFGVHDVQFNRAPLGRLSLLVAFLFAGNPAIPAVESSCARSPHRYRILPRDHALYAGPLVGPPPGPNGAARLELPADPSAPLSDKPGALGSDEEFGGLDPELHGPVIAARRNGWTYADCTGAGNGNVWTAEGGYGSRSGLTMAEMALTVPPEGWEEASAYQYPWEMAGWRAPGPGWKPGTHRAKPPMPKPEIAPPASSSVLPPEPDPDPALEVPLEGEPEPEGEAAPVEVDDSILADYGDRATIAAASGLLKQLQIEGGATPTDSKANYHLKKAELPRASPKVVKALLSLP